MLNFQICDVFYVKVKVSTGEEEDPGIQDGGTWEESDEAGAFDL